MATIPYVRVRLVHFLGLWLFMIVVLIYFLYHENPASNPDQANPLSNQPQTFETSSSFDGQPQPPTTKTTKTAPAQQFKDVEASVHKEFTVDPEEKFLAYFTHSGFHNQRIALENALLLAKLLNRTLLMPPLLLGPPVAWARFEKMYEKLIVSTKAGLEHCWKISNQIPLPAECLDYFSSSIVSWDFLLDMKPIREWHKIIDRWEPSYQWLNQNLHVSLYKDFHFIKDTTLFDYRIYDSLDSQPSAIEFKRRFDVEELAAVDKKIIHMGSLFGSYRMSVGKPDNVRHVEFIRSHLVPHNPIIHRAADSIVEQLGGAGNFIGLHIRVSDGFFMMSARENIDTMHHQIIESNTNITSKNSDVLKGEKYDQDSLIDDTVNSKGQDSYGNETKAEVNRRSGEGYSTNHIRCHRPLHPTDTGINTVIFIATDARSPRRNPLLSKFFNTFPCVFVLDDFKNDLVEIKSVRNAEDETPLSGYLINMLDAVIAANGREVYGTPKSTFSSYIKNVLHPMYVAKNQPIN